MELTERERRILVELEHQLSSGPEGQSPAIAPTHRSVRPQWTVVPAAVLGSLLLAAGIALGVAGAVLLGTLLVLWWLSPLLWRLLRRAGRATIGLFEDTPPGAAP